MGAVHKPASIRAGGAPAGSLAAAPLQEDRSGGRRTTTHVSASVSFPVAQIYRYDNDDDDDDDGKDKLIIDF
uniref:Uncharacterized protein n=1 Tax=Oryza glumipatula TaxID=40148 RepID=A0A0E0BE67_9ORYZ